MIPMMTEPMTLSRFGGAFIKPDISTQASKSHDLRPQRPSKPLEEKEVVLRGREVDVTAEHVEQFGPVLGEPGQHA